MTSDEKTTGARRAASITAAGRGPRATGALVAGTILIFAFLSGVRAQTGAVSHARDFTSSEYYPAPLERQVKRRLSAGDAQPQAGGLLIMKQLKLETFSTNGAPQVVIEAPECIYDSLHDTAASAGHLRVQNGDGKIRIEGDGFLWREDDSFLTISNHVYTVIKTSALKPTKP